MKDVFADFDARLREASGLEVRGRVTELVGIVVTAVLPECWVGELCHIHNPRQHAPIKAEVVGFRGNEALLMPLGPVSQIGMQSEVIPCGHGLRVHVGDALLGRILNGLGEPRDASTHGPLPKMDTYPAVAQPPDPLIRRRITSPLSVGVRAIDGLLTCGEGQRIGLFAPAGGGKSTLLGMLARNTEADINVVALIGERGREVNDFIHESLGAARQRSVVVVATSDEPPLVRLRAAHVAAAIADYFRDRGQRVLFLMDSVTRFARAQREVGLATGEPPARAGFTPSVFSELPRLLERSGNSEKGSITAFYTVLVEGDDLTEPVADEVRSILDGHIILSRELANSGRFPAIDILASVSRVMSSVATDAHRTAAKQLRGLLSSLERNKYTINTPLYEKGKDPELDAALRKREAIEKFLRQGVHERAGLMDSIESILDLCADLPREESN